MDKLKTQIKEQCPSMSPYYQDTDCYSFTTKIDETPKLDIGEAFGKLKPETAGPIQNWIAIGCKQYDYIFLKDSKFAEVAKVCGIKMNQCHVEKPSFQDFKELLSKESQKIEVVQVVAKGGKLHKEVKRLQKTLSLKKINKKGIYDPKTHESKPYGFRTTK